jgi:hypothetical protein
MRDPFYIYKHVHTYDDLLETGKAFLQGKMSMSLTHLDKIDPETVPLVKNLVRLHDAGFYTLDSQPGTCETGKNPDGHVYVEQQKPYVVGLLPKDKMEILLRYVRKYPGKFMYLFEEVGSTTRFRNFVKSYNVTRTKLVGEEWRYYTNIPPTKDHLTVEDFHFVQGYKKLWYVAVAMTTYCKGGLPEELLRALIKSK